MSDLVINVKQISNYPNKPASDGTETLLVQTTGLGGPYQSISAKALVSTALNNGGPLGVGVVPPTNAEQQQVFAAAINLPATAQILWDAYATTGGIETSWSGGQPGSFGFSPPVGWNWATAPIAPGQELPWFNLMELSPAGNLILPLGTLTVARDPTTSMDVATMGWVGNNTVASFNNRKGAVQLTQTDIYQALGYTDYIATQPWTINAINAGIGNLITTYPLVTTFNTRTGDILLTLSDITCTFFQPGQQPISPTPVATSNDNSIATTQWVTTFVQSELSGSGTVLASQSWVLANTVNSFNGRQGVVTLRASDVFDLGAAPLNSPAFSGIPTAPTANPGTTTGQIATTAFVQAAITAGTAGVSSFNTRTGAVTLNATDIANAGGLSNPNAALTGVPTAPTATAGTNTTQIATTQFVTTALTTNNVVSFNTRTGAVTLTLADITGIGGAPIASPTFTGIPAGPTASPGANTTQLATTSFVTQALTAAGGVSSFNSRTGAVTLTTNDVSAAGGLTNPSANLTGTPLAPTATAGTNSTQIATTAFVTSAVNASVVSFNTRTGAITLTAADITGAGGAVLASPAFTGTPTAPTATAGTNNTQLATTAFVAAAISSGTAGVTSWNTRTGAVTLQAADITGVGGALLASPALTGVPTAPTATAGTSTTQLATTAFVQGAVSTGAVSSFNTRTGAVTLQANDISAATGALVASPTFTGVPAAPTAATNTNTTQLATTAYVVGQAGTANPVMDSTAAVGTSLLYARQDHVHPSDTSRAPVASPTFTGVPAAPTATAGTSTTQLATTQFVTSAIGAAPVGSPNDVGRNVIHNGNFIIQQRGLGPWTTGTITADRWWLDLVTDTVSVTVVALADADRTAIGDENARFAIQRVFTGNAAAAAYNDMQQGIERVRRLSGKTVTVSFWAIRTAGTATRIGVNFQQAFGTGGTGISALTNATAQAVTISTTWTRYSVTIAVPSAAGKTFGTNGDDATYLAFGFSSGATNNVFYGGIGVQSGTILVYGVQVEVGSTMTQLVQRDLADEWALAQRYYRGSSISMTFGFNSWGANAYLALPVAHPVVMRATPTITLGASSGNTNIASVTVINNFPDGFMMDAAATTTGGAGVTINGFTASAEI